MRIGLLAPPFENVPPDRYGGTERVIAALADGLVERGHDVVLFATAESRTRARLVPIAEKAVWHDPRYEDDRPFRTLAVARAYREGPGLDIIHNHLDYVAYPAARLSRVPTVTTLHWTLDVPEVVPLYEEFAEQPLVSISDEQRRPLPHANWVSTVYHGCPRSSFSAGTGGGEYLAFCGRFTPEKGLESAIQVALAAEIPLRIAARCPPERSEDPIVRAEREYYEAAMRPWLDHPLIEYVGELPDAHKQAFFGDALALLFPIDWREPFGLVMIEALACGTPVLARPRGSVPEIVTDGVTGFHCESAADFVDAVHRIGRIDRGRCRAEFEARFTADTMASGYELAYAEVIASALEARRAISAAPFITTLPARHEVNGNGAGHTSANVEDPGRSLGEREWARSSRGGG